MSIPLRRHEAQRLDALCECDILETDPESSFDDLARLAAQVCEAPMAAVSLVAATRQWFKARVGLEMHGSARDVSFCAHVVASGDTMVIADARQDERFRDNPFVTGTMAVRLYAAAPLTTADGHVLGTLCVMDRRARALDQGQVRALETLARQVTAQLETRRMIRELERTQEELQKARRLADSANLAKSEFLANMSHEMRTPLTAILGFADLIASNELSGEAEAEGLRSIRRSGEHLLALINDLLDLAKVESGEVTLERAPFSVWDVVRDAGALVRVRAEQKGLALLLERADDVPEFTMGDATRVRQVLANLLDNAVKFTDRGSVHVGVRGVAGRVVFVVTDTGMGMSSDQLDRLFKPFAQGETGFARRFGGAGLGLSMARRLVESMGGVMEVESSAGRGSVFTVTIPLEPVAAPASVTVGAPTPHRLDGVRILVAEDGDDNLHLLRHVLNGAGAAVIAARDGDEAVRAALEAQRECRAFDVILMDVQMPRTDGCVATRRLRAEGYTGAIIALTAHAMQDDRERCLECGFDDYATKPIERASLLARCAAWAKGGRFSAPEPSARSIAA